MERITIRKVASGVAIFAGALGLFGANAFAHQESPSSTTEPTTTEAPTTSTEAPTTTTIPTETSSLAACKLPDGTIIVGQPPLDCDFEATVPAPVSTNPSFTG